MLNQGDQHQLFPPAFGRRNEMIRVGLLVSGQLGLVALKTVLESTRVNFVMTDSLSASIRDECEIRGIPVFLGSPRSGRAAAFLSQFQTDVILSINYLFIVEQDVLSHPKYMAANIHGSLLPKYRGRTPHVWAIINNETETGVTLHVMDSGCDTGEIIIQKAIGILPVDTGASILEKYSQVYPQVITEFFESVQAGCVRTVSQDHAKATYFGRRTPADGKIDWNWQRERVYNWIRALAKPYPGAFFRFEGKTYFVHASRFTDHGFDSCLMNGTVLLREPLVVKTPNGPLELLDHNFPVLSESEGFGQPIVFE